MGHVGAKRGDAAGVGVHLPSADNEFTGTLHPSFGQLNKCEQTVLRPAGAVSAVILHAHP